MNKIEKVLVLCMMLYLTNILDAFSQTKPNFVLFIADDLGVTDTEPYGNDVVKTPNLSRLSENSLLFKNAFASSPTCAPSRSTIFTGLMPFRHGAHSNHSGVKQNTKSVVQYMQALGYKVAIAGKYHVGPEEIFSFERIANTNVREPGTEGMPGLHYDLNMEPVKDWLSQSKNNEPFVLVVADHSPHVVWPEKTGYKTEDMDIPAQHIDTEETRRSRARYYADVTKMDKNLGELLESLDANDLNENTVFTFISDQGPQWPFGKWSLYDYGVRSPMLVRWSDKYKGGEQTDALISLADILPTLIDIAGGSVPTEIDGKSFLPVLEDKNASSRNVVYASHTGDGNMNRSPSRMIRTTRYKYILNLAPEILYTTHMDRVKRAGVNEYWESWREKSYKDEHAASVLWRYYNHPKEELYDLKGDPFELMNLAEDVNYNELLALFRENMKYWRESQGDHETGPEKLSDKKNTGKPVAPYVF